MEPNLENLDLIDLISERHLLLRKISEDIWNESSDIYISNSEWFIMARIYNHPDQQPLISYVSKHVDISRQATHKFLRSLEDKGLIRIENAVHSNRDKCARLTTLGVECYLRNLQLKADLEQRIADRLGTGPMSALKDFLKTDWGL
ncbi:MAG TPA: MarR family winged helix-turn-helix transcriptional regulator [Clostridiaceae bacterium]|nr:MarR family winged helix-turn-helix transcriptional regulator [Clostridiaceae bacterium]